MPYLTERQIQVMRWLSRHSLHMERAGAANQVTFGSLAHRGYIKRSGTDIMLTDTGQDALSAYTQAVFHQRKNYAEPTESVQIALGLVRMVRKRTSRRD